MTVCIAASADDHEAIVSCVDTRVSTGVSSVNPLVGRKMCGLRGWTILSSGTTSDAERLVDEFQRLLSEAPNNDPPTILHLLDTALRTELARHCAARHLAPYGIDMPTFLSSPTMFSDARRTKIASAIAEYSDNYDVELLVSGWGQHQESFTGDARPTGYIFTVNREGARPHSDDGFCACGSGAASAHVMLSLFNHEPRMSLAQTIYHVAAAKFECEKVGIGEPTLLRIARRLGDEEWRGYHFPLEGVERIRRIWNQTRALRFPSRAEDEIMDILVQHENPFPRPPLGYINRLPRRRRRRTGN